MQEHSLISSPYLSVSFFNLYSGTLKTLLFIMAGASYNGPVTKVELYVSCTELVNMDEFSKSDPFAVLFEGCGKSWNKMEKTEVIYDNLNPKVSPILHRNKIYLEALVAI